MRNEIFMNFHFPARRQPVPRLPTARALFVTLCLFATRSLFPAPPEMPPGFAWPVFRPARLTVPRLTTAPRFCVVTLRALRDGQLLVPPQNTFGSRRNRFFSPAGLAATCPGRARAFCRRPLWSPAGGCGHPPLQACSFSLPIWPRPRLPLRRTPRRGPISTVYTAPSFVL